MYRFPAPHTIPAHMKAEADAILASFQQQAKDALDTEAEVIDTIRTHHGPASADMARALLRQFDVSLNLLTALAQAGYGGESLKAMFEIAETAHRMLTSNGFAATLYVDDHDRQQLGSPEKCSAAADSLMKLLQGLMEREMKRITDSAARAAEFASRVTAANLKDKE